MENISKPDTTLNNKGITRLDGIFGAVDSRLWPATFGVHFGHDA